jgi:hypothetical protein
MRATESSLDDVLLPIATGWPIVIFWAAGWPRCNTWASTCRRSSSPSAARR